MGNSICLRGIWKRVVFRFKIHDYWRFDLHKVPRRADDLASFWSCGSELIVWLWINGNKNVGREATKELLIFVWLGGLSEPRPRLGPSLGLTITVGNLAKYWTWHSSITDLINCLDRHTALVYMHNLQRTKSELLIKAEVAVRYGQTINLHRMN